MLKLNNIKKTYKTKKRTREALKGITLSFENEGLVFVVGESGCGKTTLMKIISQELTASEGNIQLNGFNCDKLTNTEKSYFKSEQVGIIFQKLNLIREYTVKENILLPLRIQKKAMPTDEELQKVLKKYNLRSELLNSNVSELSGGEAQRVAIIRAIIKDPMFIVADEPTGSLDEKNAITVIETLKEISKDRLVIVVSHSPSLASKFADRIIELDSGRIKSDTNEPKSIQANKSPIQYTKVSLPIKDKCRLSIRTLKKGKVRLALAMISTLLTTALFIFSFTILFRDAESQFIKTINNEKITTARVSLIHHGTSQPISKSNKEKHFSEFEKTDSLIVPVYLSGVSTSPNLNGVFGNDKWLDGAISINENQIKRMKFTLWGNLPENDSINSEIALTKYTCYLLGWLTEETYNDEEAIQRIIDQKQYIINLTEYSIYSRYEVNYDVVGIVDTNISLFADRNTDKNNQEILKEDLSSGLHKTVLLGESTYNEIIDIYMYLKDPTLTADDFEPISIHIIIDGKTLLELLEISVDEYKVTVRYKFASSLDIIERQLLSYSYAFLVFAVVFGIITLFSFTSLISNKIAESEITIKVLKSLGMKFRDIMGIFIIQSMSISLICVIIALVCGFFGSIITSTILLNSYSVYYVVPGVNIFVVLSTLLVLSVLSSSTVFVACRKKIN